MLEFKVTSTSHVEISADLTTARDFPFEEWLDSHFDKARINIRSVGINIDFVKAPEKLINILGRILKKYKILEVAITADLFGIETLQIETIASNLKDAGVQVLRLRGFCYSLKESIIELIKQSNIKLLSLGFNTANSLPREIIPKLNQTSRFFVKIVFDELLAKPSKSVIPQLQELEDNSFQFKIRLFYNEDYMNYFVKFLTLGKFEYLDLSNNNLAALPDDIWEIFCATLSKSFVGKLDVTGNDLSPERLNQLLKILKINQSKKVFLDQGLQRGIVYKLKQTFLMSIVGNNPDNPDAKYLILKDKTKANQLVVKRQVDPGLVDLIEFEMTADFSY